MSYRILFSILSINLIQLLSCQFVNSSICQFGASAQRHIVFSDDIRSVQVVAGNKWQELPIILLGSGEHVNISFDELSHEYHRYEYSVVHLDKDWKEDEGLMAADYVRGFQSGLTIEDYEESINTTQDYTHYKLQIPNSQCRLRMSGNYRVDITEDGETRLSVFFLVSENIMNVGTSYSGDTDIDVRRNHQQVRVKADYSALNATDPLGQITGYVVKNYNWSTLRQLPKPTSFNQQYMEWTHCRDLIYEGGNEYHKFEMLDIHRNSLNIENNTWDAENEIWHTYVWADYRRPSYVYDETPKGAFLIRNSNNSESNITSEYVMVHFTLQTEAPFPYPVYVDGMWAVDNRNYLMTYDTELKAYTVAVPLKYGYYSYQYVMKTPDGTTIIPPTEGSFYETRNNYTALFYYRGTLDRGDRLVGVKN